MTKRSARVPLLVDPAGGALGPTHRQSVARARRKARYDEGPPRAWQHSARAPCLRNVVKRS